VLRAAAAAHAPLSRRYAAVVASLPRNARVLDIGIGTASALAANAAASKARGLKWVGVDYDANYVRRAQAVVAKAGLSESVRVKCASIFEAGLLPRLEALSGGEFDAVFFSGSLMIMPEPERALRIAAAALRPGGKVYIAQTFQTR